MRNLFALAATLAAGCASSAVPEEPDDPEVLHNMLRNADPLRREEAAQRLLRRGMTIDEEGGQTDGLKSVLDIVLKEPDPQRLIWRAYHAIRERCLARDWKIVAADLDRQGFRLQEMYEPHERSKFVRFTARAVAYVNGAGDKHDLFFWIHAVPRAEERWMVREVYVGLHAAFDAPFKTLAERDAYPRGSVMAQFFELPEVKKLVTVFPILEEIELTYGRLREKDPETVPAGFHLNAGFVTAKGERGGRGLYYTAESGLDPRETRSGKFIWDGFTSSDTLGPLTPRGSSFWGAGGLRPSDD